MKPVNLETEPPIFQVLTKAGQLFRIWEDGRTDGFPDVVGVCNAIPLVAMRERALIARKVDA